jgi:hypothetical protein
MQVIKAGRRSAIRPLSGFMDSSPNRMETLPIFTQKSSFLAIAWAQLQAWDCNTRTY